jgi:hypothetical protein
MYLAVVQWAWAFSRTLAGTSRRKQNTMDPTSEARNIAKEQYTNVRRSLADFEERVIASRWDEDTLVRTGFDRFLGSLDRIADWLFAEGDQPEDEEPESGVQPEGEAHEEPEPVHHESREPAKAEQPWAEATDAPTQGEPDMPAPTGQAAPREPEAAEQALVTEPLVDEPGIAEQARAGTVDVVFTLPADVEAFSVALCGEFNGWAEDDILLSRDAYGTWCTTVALMPGRYRYRFLIDGKRWENARQADDYVPNPFGELDSVVIVSS